MKLARETFIAVMTVWLRHNLPAMLKAVNSRQHILRKFRDVRRDEFPDEVCPICLDKTFNAVKTKCNHVYHW